MTDEFPSNSRRPGTPEKPEAKKVEPVVTGEVVLRRKSPGKRLIETFLGGSARQVAQFVLTDVLLPAAKDMIADSVSQGVERLIYGEARSVGRRTGFRPGSPTNYTSYTSYSRMQSPANNPLPARREDPRMARPVRGGFDFNEVILATRVEAEEVIDRMFDLLQRYETVSVGDLYELLGKSASYTEEKYGWTDLRGAGVTRIRDGYLLDLPQPEPLK